MDASFVRIFNGHAGITETYLSIQEAHRRHLAEQRLK
jgi:hypothetical protein